MTTPTKFKCERYSTGKYSVSTTPPYPMTIGHVVGGKDRWEAGVGPLTIGFFKTKKLAVAAVVAEFVKDSPASGVMGV